jgi:hypothetical protein
VEITKSKRNTLILGFIIFSFSLFFILEFAFSSFLYFRPPKGDIKNIQFEASKHRVLCIGESTTEGTYPAKLQIKLDQIMPNSFKVYDFGLTAMTTDYFKNNINEILNKTKPHTVITMLGINDEFQLSKAISGESHWYTSLLSYRVFLYLSDHNNNNFEDQALKLINAGKEDMAHKILKILYLSGIKLSPAGYLELHELEFVDDSENDNYDNYNDNNTKIINEALSYYPEDHRLRFERLNILLNTKKTILMERELQYFDKIPKYYDELGMFYFTALGKPKKAMDYFEKAFVNNLLTEEGAFQYAALLQGVGNVQKSLKVLEKKYPLSSSLSAVEAIETKRFSDSTITNLRYIYDRILKQKSNLIIMNYPLRPIQPMKIIFNNYGNKVLFLENETNFRRYLNDFKYDEIFEDSFAGDFGHLTPKGNDILIDNLVLNYFQK